MKEITRQWLDFALTDLKSCENNIGDEFLTNIVVFHSQQATEKCIKAFMEEKNIKLPRIHNLVRLFVIVESQIPFKADMDMLALLDGVYTSSRYPSDLGLLPYGKPTKEAALEIYQFALNFYNQIEKLLIK